VEQVIQPLSVQSKMPLYRKGVLSVLRRFKVGHLNMTLPDGEMINIGEGAGLSVDIRIHDERFFKNIFLSGDIGFGESYMEGYWSTSDLTRLIRWGIQNLEHSPVMSGSQSQHRMMNMLEIMNKFIHYLKRNSKKGSQKNIAYHYDLSNRFYEKMLDKSMTYSCGIFSSEKDSLYDAQINKYQQLCDDLDIQAGDHILEIGCGWGGFAEYAATNYDCKITAITLSKEQYHYAVNRIQQGGIGKKVDCRLIDYRDLKGIFDKVISIEMIEAVGHKYLPSYFQMINRLLKPDGVAVIQGITCPDSRYLEFKNGIDFIQKYIFPGSLLPSVSSMVSACQKKTELQLHNLRDIGLHYAKTLALWMEKVEQFKHELKDLGFDDVFYRKWKYYLCYCEAAFAERNISTLQLTFIKPNNTSYRMHSPSLG
jgi:cyclopropane-fatty-acyl-phospholipid synthase